MDSPRNVILLSLDALRADHLSCYGYDRETSPRLDGFAEDGVLFSNAYSASSHTREAVPSLLTGRYPDEAVDSGYHRDAETLASELRSAGYATAGFHSNPFVSRAYGFDQGFETFDDDLHLGQNKLFALAQRALDKLRNRHYARADEINERSLAWLDSVDDDRPVFLWNHYMDPHGPYEAPAEYQQRFHGETVSDRHAQKLYQRAIDDPNSITDEERERLIDLYDAEIRYSDDHLDAFFDALEDRGLLEESLVVVTADHGDAFGEHGYYEHPRQLHDELVHVPLIVSHPDVDPGRIGVPTSTLDVVRTALEVVGVSAGDHAGCDLLSVANRPNEYEERVVFSQARGEDEHAHVRRFSARSRSGTEFAEYDVDADSVAVDGDRDGDLEERLREFVRARSSGSRCAESEAEAGEDVDDAIEDRLSALGYK